MLQEVRTKTLVLSEDYDKRDKELYDKKCKQFLDKGWERLSDNKFVKRIIIKK